MPNCSLLWTNLFEFVHNREHAAPALEPLGVRVRFRAVVVYSSCERIAHMIGIPQLPCSSCTAECCGPVRLTTAVYDRIVAYLKSLPLEERHRLAKQKRSSSVCRFVDTETFRCSVYPVRPEVCKLFGRVPGMVCQKVGILVQIVPAFEVEQRMLTEFLSPDVPFTFSNVFDWRKV